MKTTVSRLIPYKIRGLSNFILKNRITPQQITVEPSIRWLLKPIDLRVNIFNLNHLWWDTAMDAQIQIIDDTHQRKSIKEVHDQIISLLIVLFQALVSESEVLGHTPALVVTSLQSDLLWVIDFES